jgi:hypothetical protein
MSVEIKLSQVPVETADVLTKENQFGIRLTGILKKINFPGREKTVFTIEKDYFSDEWILKMRIQVTDSGTGGPLSLEHGIRVIDTVSDDVIAERVFIMVTQATIHEFMEQFRFNGRILFNPHERSQNEIFSAIENFAAPRKSSPPPEFTVFFNFSDRKTQKSASKEPEKEVPTKKEAKKMQPKFFHKFAPPEPWRVVKRRAA